MPVIKIENFGGEMPSLSARALPNEGAQENSNLFAGAVEFRPLKTDTSIGVSVAGAKSLFRISPAQPWVTSTQGRSYVRGQINGDVSQRTYYSVDTGSAQPPRAVDTTGADRQLGVPVPAKPSVTVNVSDEITLEEADAFCYGPGARSIRTTIGDHKQAGLVAPSSNFGLVGHEYGPLPNELKAQPWCLFAEITVVPAGSADEAALFGLGARRGSNGNLFLPLSCRAYRPILNAATCGPALAALMGPDGTTPFLNTGMVGAITTLAAQILDPDEYAPREKTEVNALVQEFAALVGSIVVTVPPTRPVAPTKPTVEQYVLDGVGGEGGSYVRSTAWVDYDAALAAYQVALETYVDAKSVTETRVAEVRDRLLAVQQRSASLVKSMEDKAMALWDRISRPDSEIQSLISTLGGVAILVPYAVRREVESRFYVVTFVTDWGEESAPSAVSDMAELDQNDGVTLPRPPLAAGGTYASRSITHWRLYRSNAGTDTAAFQFEAELPVTTAAYTGNVLGSALGEVLPTATWAEPPADLRGLVGMPNGIMAGFTGQTVAFCEPYVPYAWPVEYQVTTEYPIVGMAVFGQTLFVGTTGNPYFISGADSASMSAVKMESNQACASARSIAAVQGGVLFASPDGLCVADPSGVKVVSQGLYTREDWQALAPSSMFAVEHEGVYYLFYNNGTKGCLAFDLAAKKLSRVDLQADAAYGELVSDTLFVVSGTSILAAFAGSASRTGRWKSKRMTMPAQVGMAWLKVYGDQTALAPVTVRIYGDGALRHTATVTNTSPQRLPTGRWLEYEVEVESTARITRVVIAGNTQELQSV